jgi:hypothetical protein
MKLPKTFGYSFLGLRNERTQQDLLTVSWPCNAQYQTGASERAYTCKDFRCLPLPGVSALECPPCSDFVTRDMKVCVKVVVAWLGERGMCGAPLVSDRGAMQERCQGVAD